MNVTGVVAEPVVAEPELVRPVVADGPAGSMPAGHEEPGQTAAAASSRLVEASQPFRTSEPGTDQSFASMAIPPSGPNARAEMAPWIMPPGLFAAARPGG